MSRVKTRFHDEICGADYGDDQILALLAESEAADRRCLAALEELSTFQPGDRSASPTSGSGKS